MEKFSVVDGMWTIKLRRNDVQDVRRCGILGNLWSVFVAFWETCGQCLQVCISIYHFPFHLKVFY